MTILFPVTTIEVKTDKELDVFIKFPFALYSKDKFYSPQLIRDQREHFSLSNPFFKHAKASYFIAEKNGIPAGRIAAIIDKNHINAHNEKAGFFGFFECINDQEVAHSLLNKVSEYLRGNSMEIMRGPMNFSTNEECGFLLQGFDEPPMLMTPYNPVYYHQLMEEYGLQKAKDLYAFIYEVEEALPEKILRVAQIGEKRGITVRHVEKKNFAKAMKAFQEIYNTAWKDNWGFMPLTDEELVYMGGRLKQIIVPCLTLIAEDRGRPVGFMAMIPDFNAVLRRMKARINPVTIMKALYYSKKITDLRMMLLGIKKDYRNKGVDAVLFREGFSGIKKGGYQRVEFSWILEDNIPVQRLVEMIGGRLYKKYRIYEKGL